MTLILEGWIRALQAFPVDRDAAHILLGLAVMVLVQILSRRGFESWWPMFPGLALSLAVEAILLWQADFAGAAWRAVTVDLLLVNGVPALLTFLTRRGVIKG